MAGYPVALSLREEAGDPSSVKGISYSQSALNPIERLKYSRILVKGYPVTLS